MIALVAGGLTVVLVAAVAAFVLLRDEESGGGPEQLRVGQIAGGAEARPGADGSLTMVRPGVERPVVEVYEDFACPPCGRFDRAVDPMLKELAVAGRAKVVFRPMVIFAKGVEPMHGNSLRAASALRCVTDGARWLSFQDVLYTHQPAEETTRAYEISDLLSYGASVGLTDSRFRRCVTEQARAEDVLSASRTYTTSHGVHRTPSVRVDGRLLSDADVHSPDALRRAIEAAS
ncbi:UNVERIFIED_ORG: thioredoxin-like protein [Actinomadura viridilutea]|uniref:DsbA family protein n=1 Tax=Actinomadura rubrobrunea TaxID=115335 RepID=UPI000834C7F3|nr:thioredoxin domain-containing protein [Actinomadura rubrobrunea]